MAKALILGFGGSGAQTLTFVKEIAVRKEGGKPKKLSFLLFDTIEGWEAGKTVQLLGGRGTETLASSGDKDANLDKNDEYFYLSDRDPNLNRRVTEAKLPAYLADWLHAQWLALHVTEAARTIKDGAAQQRQIGRFAIFQNAVRIYDDLTRVFRDTRATDVWLIGSSAGGTGAGGLLDAALLVRRAARESSIPGLKVTGVVVLPDVYSDKDGISKGRAYAFFRELARLQENGFDAGEDPFWAGNDNITLRVRYDSTDRITATRTMGGLFDAVFYVGTRCQNDVERATFFSSLAMAIDPYLDERAGSSLLQASVNGKGKLPSSFGASRIYLPMPTLADLYGWEEVQSYVDAITAPQIVNGRVIDVEAGPSTDSRAKAQETVKLLLPFFGWLDSIATTVESNKWREVGLQLAPMRLVEEHLQFASAQQAGLRLAAGDPQLIAHTYRNPYVSLTEADPKERRLKTINDMHKSGQKETLEESQQRFQRDLDTITSAYRSRQAADRSFRKGEEIIRQKLTPKLQERVDELVTKAFRSDTIGKKSEADGTTLTRLYKLLVEALADDGPVRNARAVLNAMLDAAREEESRAGQKLQQAQADLNQWRPSGWLKGGSFTNKTSLSDLQAEVVERAGKAAETYQRYKLLGLVSELLDQTEGRLVAWHSQARVMLNGLLLAPGADSAFEHARGAIGELESRLSHQATEKLAIIDPVNVNIAGDTQLHGYRAQLKDELTKHPGGATLSSDYVKSSKWEAIVDAGNQPRLALTLPTASYDASRLTNFAADLHALFRRHIDKAAETKNVFHYLRYLRTEKSLKTDAIATLLDQRAKALINLEDAPEEKYLAYAAPTGANADEHSDLAEAILGKITGVSYYDHSDRFSIYLLKVKKPKDMTEIQDVQECLKAYLKLQTDKIKNIDADDAELRRSEVYHIFRAELEAWYIEREALLQRRVQATVDHHIPPRIARLLDDPQRMSAFVKCLATGAVWEDDAGWWWLAPNGANGEKVPLNDPGEGKTTVIRAAVNFVLRGESGLVMGSHAIPLSDVNRSVSLAVARKQKSEPDLLLEFAGNLDSFLDRSFANLKNLPQEQYQPQRAALKTVLAFYATPGRSTDLVKRML